MLTSAGIKTVEELEAMAPSEIFAISHCDTRREIWVAVNKLKKERRGRQPGGDRYAKRVDMSLEAFVTPDEVAAHLKATRRHVLELTRKGVLPAHPLCFGSRRKTWRYKLSEIDQAIAPWAKKPVGVGGLVNISRSERTMPVGSPRSQKEQSNG